jgi:light-regulated signal transduction histidine kinase (bacteriophytochrome)
MLGFLAGFIDTIFDYFIFYQGQSFLELLVIDVPQHEIYIRFLSLVCFVVFGFICAKIISRQKKAEEELLKVTRELQSSNAELEQFARITSHDLHEPLLAISGFVKLLKRRYRGKLDAKADEFIDFTIEGTSRMEKLLRDLLEYSRIGSKKKPYRELALGSLLDQALQNLKSNIDASGAEVKAHNLPSIWVDDTLIIQLFQNLVGNAIKFSGNKAPVIEIFSEKREKDWVISIRDNGIGIDPQYADQIFIIFNRLHRENEYLGTGLGLAICKKIMARHEGDIWVDSVPGKGSTFSFSLPANVIPSDHVIS